MVWTENPEKKIFMKNDKVLIVGGTGFIGRNLAARCMENTDNVACLGVKNNIDRTLLSGEIDFLHADIGNKSQLKSVLNNRRFDYVFNLGGYIDHTPYFKGGRELI